MAEVFERDDYSFEEYSDESINVGCVCSWSIQDVAQHRPVVTVFLQEVHFNSDSERISDGQLYKLADRLQQAGTGNAMARLTKRRRPALRASLRDYDQDSQWAMMGSLTPPRRIGERLEREKVPNESLYQAVRRTVLP